MERQRDQVGCECVRGREFLVDICRQWQPESHDAVPRLCRSRHGLPDRARGPLSVQRRRFGTGSRRHGISSRCQHDSRAWQPPDHLLANERVREGGLGFQFDIHRHELSRCGLLRLDGSSGDPRWQLFGDRHLQEFWRRGARTQASSAAFTIAASGLLLRSPGAEVMANAGSTLRVAWQRAGYAGGVDVYLRTSSGGPSR